MSEIAPPHREPKTPLLEVSEARRIILSGLPLMRSEQVALDEAFARTSARSVKARVTSPPFDVSAMDGYAVRFADVPTPGVILPIRGESRAGTQPVPVLAPGSCMRIFTGAPVPDGADSIIIQEDTAAAVDGIRFTEAAVERQHIRRAGGNFREGDICVEDGRVLTARDLGLLAAAGHSMIDVRKQPRIGVLSTGDELARWSRHAGPGQIHDANRPALKAAIRAWGGVPVDLGIAADDPQAIADAVRGSAADLVVITGGASVGDHDHVRPALESIGLRVDFWKIRMRPGKPLMFGEIMGLPVLGMPGNPVSALVCALLFLRPAIAAMVGATVEPAFEKALLMAPLKQTGPRDDYLRAEISIGPGGGLGAKPFAAQDSSMLGVMAQATGLIMRPAGAPAAGIGEFVSVLRFDSVGGF